MKKKTYADGNVSGFPATKVICDAFRIIIECIEGFEVSSRPTMHIALPMVFKAIRNLEYVAGGSTEWRKNCFRMVRQSIYSKLPCRNLGEYLQANLKPHPLLHVGCYLNPLFRGFKFVSDSKVRRNMLQKVEDMTRKLTRCFLNCTNANDFDSGKSIQSEEEPSENDECSASNGPNFSSIGSSVLGKKRTFSLLDLADSEPETSKPQLGESESSEE